MRVPSILALATLACIALAPVTSAWEGTCQAPLLATQGSHPNSVIEHYHIDMGIFAHDEDWWLLTVPPNHAATATLTTNGFNSVMGYVYASDPLVCPGTWVMTMNFGSTFTPANTTGQDVGYLINVHAAAGLWNAYSLDVQLQPTQGCGAGFSDSFEPNSPVAPRTLTSGAYGPMSCASDDADGFGVRVPPGSTLTVQTSFQNALGDLDLFLVGPMGEMSVTGTEDVETITWTSNLSSSTTPIVKVQSKASPLPVFACNRYVLDVRVDSPNVGTIECDSTRNSSGLAASMRGYGSRSVALNTLNMAADGMPGGAPCVLFTGTTATQSPFGVGFMCVAAPRIRLFQSTASATGSANLRADLQVPSLQGLAVAGSTLHFQALYRDLALPGGFNLTDAFAVTCLP